MNKSLYIAALVALFSASVFVSCQSKNEEKENVEKALSDVKEDISQIVNDSIVYTDWSTFKSASEKTIDNNNQRIVELKEKVNKPGMKNLDKLREKRIDELQEENAELRTKIAVYNNAQTKTDWETFKADFKKDLDALVESLDDLSKDKK